MPKFEKVIYTKDSPADYNYANDLENRIDIAINPEVDKILGLEELTSVLDTVVKNLPKDGSFDPSKTMTWAKYGNSYVIKFENGLMLLALRIEGTTDTDGRVTTVYPENFSDTPLPVGIIGLNVSMRILNTIAFNFTSSQITTTSYNISTNNMSTNNNIVYAALLIGRYK